MAAALVRVWYHVVPACRPTRAWPSGLRPQGHRVDGRSLATVVADDAVPYTTASVEDMVAFCHTYASSLLVLTGAGVSTASGIPDYRGVNGSYKRGHKPMLHGEFMGSVANRQRYWARSMMGYKPFSRARPNAGHRALASLQARGVVGRLISQNVDGLHQRAGSRDVLDLHGRIDTVKCTACGFSADRGAFQSVLEEENPGWVDAEVVELRADADAVLHGADYDTFVVPSCTRCGGVLKPDVVFFGGSVDRGVLDAARRAVDEARAVLVVGSTCSTYSAYQLVTRAVSAGKPVALLNQGPTRMHASGLPLALHVEGDCAAGLESVARAFQGARPAGRPAPVPRNA